jgi:peptidyl-prolyl cis-trans isomerase B (cyclophilin B)
VPSNEQRRKAAKRKLERRLQQREARAKRRRTITIVSTLVVVVAVVVGVFYLTHTGQPSAAPAASQPAAVKTTQGPCQYTTTPEQPASRPVGLPPDPNPTPNQGTEQVTLKTNRGDIPVTLNRAEAPCTVQSFLHLVQSKFYDNTPCPRISTGQGLLMLQCGDPTGTGTGGPGYKFKDETKPNLTYPAGTLAMANSGPNTNGSQFFMVFGNSQLPPNYTVFGTISPAGLNVLNTVAKAGSDNSSPAGGGKPNLSVQIEQATARA